MAPPPKRTRAVLITGCSAGGLGHALALAFHETGSFRVFATARDVSRMTELRDRGIECLALDVCDKDSIHQCVDRLRVLTRPNGEGGPPGSGNAVQEGMLDCLVNNAGGGYSMPVADIAVAEAKALFDLNVWATVRMTQVCLPLLLHAASSTGGPSLIVNNTSVSSVEPTPHNSVYHASKAAAAMFSTHMRIELAPFNVRVVDLKTGCVHSHFHANHQEGTASLPPGSIYMPVRAQTEQAMRNAFPHREDPQKWAADVVRDLANRWDNPPKEIWRGTGAWRTWFANTFFPVGWWDESWRRAVGLDGFKGQTACPG